MIHDPHGGARERELKFSLSRSLSDSTADGTLLILCFSSATTSSLVILTDIYVTRVLRISSNFYFYRGDGGKLTETFNNTLIDTNFHEISCPMEFLWSLKRYLMCDKVLRMSSDHMEKENI